jgi:hypothetical protein
VAAERIPLQRSVAMIREDTIAVRPGRRQLAIPLVQAGITALVVWLLITFLNVLPLWVLVVLLMMSLLLGPAAVLGFVYSVYGTEFLVERRNGTARWHQGFLGLGIGTFELVPFERIARIEVQSDLDEDLSSGQSQDLVRLDVRIVKDNGRMLDVGSVTVPHALLEEATVRVNRLAAALGEMTGREHAPLVLPPGALEQPAAAAPGRRRVRRLPRAPQGAQPEEAP